MMKKIVCLMLALVVALGLCVGITSISVVANADTEISLKDLFGATNTYDLKGNVVKETRREVFKDLMGYENPQYSFQYDFSVKNANTTTAAPYVTVFTHGYYSYASDWSNNAEFLERGDGLDKFIFQYSSFSMVSQVASEVFKGNTLIIRGQLTEGIKTDTDTELDTETEPYYSLNFFKVEEGSVNKEIKLNELATAVGSKHLIVIFDGHKTNCSNDNIYYQFNYMLSSILYKLKDNYGGKIPKVNLIGHSRGGITNMQYALDHPDIVANLISLGTPYDGSTIAAIGKAFGKSLGDGLNDIIEPDKYNGYKERWNAGYNTLYKNINTLAIGAYSSLQFFGLVAHSDRSERTFNFWGAIGIDFCISVVSTIKSGTLGSGGFAILRAITKVLNEIFAQNVATNIAQALLNEIKWTPYGVVWLSDTFVPLDSQMGLLYNGFRRYTKYFSTLKNFNIKRIAQWNAPIVHNLEPWDEEIINRVVEELKPSVTDGTENFKYKENSDGTINISGLKAAADSNILDIPATINGKTVRGISSGAFAGEPSVIGKLNAETTTNATNSEYNILSNITSINIPSSITEIGSEAFNGLKSLTTISFINNSQLQTIGANAFADCVNLKNISLPSGVTKIPYGAFENCKELESLTIPSGVTKIGAQAFCGAEKLSFTRLPASVTEIGELAFFGCKGSSSITLPSGVSSIGDGAFAGIENVTAFSVSSANANYTTENGVLYNKAKTELLQYPKAKTATTFTVNSDDEVVSSNVNTIKPYAFYGCENLMIFNLGEN